MVALGAGYGRLTEYYTKVVFDNFLNTISVMFSQRKTSVCKISIMDYTSHTLHPMPIQLCIYFATVMITRALYCEYGPAPTWHYIIRIF